jgi:hydroxymethylbilane synthase
MEKIKRMKIRIGTRGSKLALAQSEWVKARIEKQQADVQVDLVIIKTKGDKIIDTPLSRIGGKGLFVTEIEDALLKKEIDLAVHSMKDMPAEVAEGLKISIFPEREDPRDAFISLEYPSFQDLPGGARVGTSSLRRSAQLLSLRPELTIVPLRGNVDTRLKKLETEDLQAVILAVAGLNRLGLEKRITQILEPDVILPAIGQGALGIEIRENDQKLDDLLGFLNHGRTETIVRAERAFLKRIEGGCQVPLAAYGRFIEEKILLEGFVSELDGTRVIKNQVNGKPHKPEKLGEKLAEILLDSGGREILDKVYRELEIT